MSNDIDKQEWRSERPNVEDIAGDGSDGDIVINWKSDLLECLKTPKSNFSDKDRWIIGYVEALITQAKAEQKEEDARIAESNKHNNGETCPHKGYCNHCGGSSPWIHDEVCDSIASEIRGQHANH